MLDNPISLPNILCDDCVVIVYPPQIGAWHRLGKQEVARYTTRRIMRMMAMTTTMDARMHPNEIR